MAKFTVKNIDGRMMLSLKKKIEDPEQEEEKEEPQESTYDLVVGCIGELVAYNLALQIAHWQANTVTNEHKALGELYESMVDLADMFTETYMGKTKVIPFPKVEIIDVSDKPCSKGIEIVHELQEYFETPEDDDVLNILADMLIALHKAKYLLKEG